jgi:hypothetical protein
MGRSCGLYKTVWAGDVTRMRDGMGRACGLYDRQNGQGMWPV